MPKMRHWTIAPLLLATAVRDRSQTILLGDIGHTVEGAVLAWLLMSGGEKILVDTGLGLLNTPDARNLFDRGSDLKMETQLMRFNTVAEEIKLVVNTHLHIDHCGGNVFFKGARCLVQRRELEYARKPLPAHRPAYGIDLTGFDFELLDGDAEIVPGIRVVLMPGHTPGSQVVLVDTEKGLYIIAGDTITHFLNMDVPDDESFLPGPIYVDLRETYESLDRLKNMGGFILPGHDPLVLKQETYP